MPERATTECRGGAMRRGSNDANENRTIRRNEWTDEYNVPPPPPGRNSEFLPTRPPLRRSIRTTHREPLADQHVQLHDGREPRPPHGLEQPSHRLDVAVRVRYLLPRRVVPDRELSLADGHRERLDLVGRVLECCEGLAGRAVQGQGVREEAVSELGGDLPGS